MRFWSCSMAEVLAPELGAGAEAFAALASAAFFTEVSRVSVAFCAVVAAASLALAAPALPVLATVFACPKLVGGGGTVFLDSATDWTLFSMGLTLRAALLSAWLAWAQLEPLKLQNTELSALI